MNIVLPAIFLTVAASAQGQSTWFVDAGAVAPGSGTASSPYQSLQFAIDHQSTLNGDLIEVAAGTYSEAVDFGAKELRVRGASAATTLIVPPPSNSGVRIAGGQTTDTSLEGFSIDGGTGSGIAGGTAGGGVFLISVNVLLIDCEIKNSSAGFGGGIFIFSGNLEMRGVTLRDNEALNAVNRQGGGLHATGGASILSQDCLFVGNQASQGGGLFQLDGSLVMNRDRFEANQASANGTTAHGAGVALYGMANASFTDVEFIQNEAPVHGRGGGLYVEDASVDALRCLFEGNRVASSFAGNFEGAGAGVWVGPSSLVARFERCTLRDNRVGFFFDGQGGGGAGDALWERCAFVGNYAPQGGGIAGGEATNCVFFMNVGAPPDFDSPTKGGAAFQSVLNDCVLQSNGSGEGGGAYGSTLNRCLVKGNSAAFSNNHSRGGGLYLSTATDCVIENNDVDASFPAQGQGGGASESTLLRCTIRNNRVACDVGSTGEAIGGGTYNCNLDRCFVLNNVSEGVDAVFAPDGVGGGIYGGTATDTLIRGNVATIVTSLPHVEVSLGGGAANAALTRCVLLENRADHGAGASGCTLVQCTLAGNVATLGGWCGFRSIRRARNGWEYKSAQ